MFVEVISYEALRNTPCHTACLRKCCSFPCFGSSALLLQTQLLFAFWMNALCKQIFPADFWGTLCCWFTSRCSHILAVGCHPEWCPSVLDGVTEPGSNVCFPMGLKTPVLTVRLLWLFNSTGWSCWLSTVLSACNCCSWRELNGGSLGRQQAAGVGRRSPWHCRSQVPAGDGWWGLSRELLPSSSGCFVQKQPWLLLSQAISSSSVGNPERQRKSCLP